MLEDEERAPFLVESLPLVPEGLELLLLLLGEPEPELLELPVGLVLAGGAKEEEKKGVLRKQCQRTNKCHGKTHFQQS